MNDPASYIDHTLLRPDATEEGVAKLCEEAVEYGCAAVCVPPVYVSFAANLLYGSNISVGTVVGFPCGFSLSETKVFEAERAVTQGASEIDMVISLGAARAGLYDVVEKEIRAVTGAVPDAVVKVIIECAYFDETAKKHLVESVVSGGARYVKTSTGFAPSGATLDDVRLLVEASGGRVAVKAAGGIRDLETVRAFLDAGATRIGTSATQLILEEWRAGLP